MRGLAAKLGVTKPVITRALDTMGKLELVSRRRDEADRRNVVIQRTPKGALAVERLGDLLIGKAQGVAAVNFDPRITPARPDLAAKHLEGKVTAARFVEGEEREVIDRAGAGARARPRPMPARYRSAEGRARHGLRDQRRRLGWGQLADRRLCRLAAGECAARAAGRSRRTR